MNILGFILGVVKLLGKLLIISGSAVGSAVKQQNRIYD